MKITTTLVALTVLAGCGVINKLTGKGGGGGGEGTSDSERSGVISGDLVASDGDSNATSIPVLDKKSNTVRNLVLAAPEQKPTSTKKTKSNQRRGSVVSNVRATPGSTPKADTLGEKRVLKQLVGYYNKDCSTSYQKVKPVWSSLFSPPTLNGISYTTSEKKTSSKYSTTVQSQPSDDIYKCNLVVLYAVYTEGTTDVLYCPTKIDAATSKDVYAPWTVTQQFAAKPATGTEIVASGIPGFDLAQIADIKSVKFVSGDLANVGSGAKCDIASIKTYFQSIADANASVKAKINDSHEEVVTSTNPPTVAAATSNILYMSGMYFIGSNAVNPAAAPAVGQCGLPSAGGAGTKPCASLEVMYAAQATAASISNTLIRDCKQSDGYAQDVPAPNYCFGIAGKCDGVGKPNVSFVTKVNSDGTGFSQSTLAVTLPRPVGLRSGQPADRWILLPREAFSCAEGAPGDTLDVLSLDKCSYKDVDDVWRKATGTEQLSTAKAFYGGAYMSSVVSNWTEKIDANKWTGITSATPPDFSSVTDTDKYLASFVYPTMPNKLPTSQPAAKQRGCGLGGFPMPSNFDPTWYQATFDRNYNIPSPTLIMSGDPKQPADLYNTVVFNHCETDDSCGFNFMMSTGFSVPPTKPYPQLVAPIGFKVIQKDGMPRPLFEPKRLDPYASVSLSTIQGAVKSKIDSAVQEKDVVVEQMYLVLAHAPTSEDGQYNLDLCGYEVMRVSVNVPGNDLPAVTPTSPTKIELPTTLAGWISPSKSQNLAAALKDVNQENLSTADKATHSNVIILAQQLSNITGLDGNTEVNYTYLASPNANVRLIRAAPSIDECRAAETKLNHDVNEILSSEVFKGAVPSNAAPFIITTICDSGTPKPSIVATVWCHGDATPNLNLPTSGPALTAHDAHKCSSFTANNMLSVAPCVNLEQDSSIGWTLAKATCTPRSQGSP